MEIWQEIIVVFFLIVAGFFGLVGSFGLIKLPDPMTRLHAPTKATTLGVGGVLIASMLITLFSEGRLSFHELLITLFLFLTAPITANMIAKSHLHRQGRNIDPNPADNSREGLPQPPGGKGWATFDDSAALDRKVVGPVDQP